ncbi:MAG: efflux RND transporter permease subunit, partial [Proteobacteria bacterium]
MSSLYVKPLRVYLILGALAIWGVFSGLGLSTSLFPMSSQATVSVSVSYGSYSSKQFYDSVGRDLEGLLQSVKALEVPVENLRADYRDRSANYRVRFEWGADPAEAAKSVETRVNSFLNRFEKDIRDSAHVSAWRQNQGFFAVSFYSPLRPLDELHRVMEPFVRPLNARVADAEGVSLYNPNAKEITVLLQPERMAQYGVGSRQIEGAIADSIFALNGGTLRIGEREYQVRLPKRAETTDILANIRVSPVGTRVVLLKDVATLRVIPSEDNNQRFRTSGVDSLILFANPKEGGNIKRMSDEIMANLEASRAQWPADVQFRVIVNPAEFIDRSIKGVLHEVAIAAFLAVLVLFFFIGSFRNVITAAIEIPLSLLLAFILMKLAGMNLNLISLGGLALSAGMNVDASVVVLENIFRHFDGKPKNLSFEEKTRLVGEAVSEVRLPILASTIASLVVFLPLIFTRGLTNSLLGDLAKAVIFSHGLSAIVA